MSHRYNCLVIILFLSVAISSTTNITSYVASRLHITDIERYETCPFHAVNAYAYACQHGSPQRTERILSYINVQFSIFKNFSDLSGQTICFAGDSLMRNQFTGLACLLWEADSSITVKGTSVVVSPHIMKITSPKFNLELQFMFAGTLTAFHEKMLPRIYKDLSHVKIFPAIRELLRGDIKTFRRPTVLILTAGHHFDPELYGQHGSFDLQLYRMTMTHVGHLLQKFMKKHKLSVRVVWRSVPPRHYEHGEWNTGGQCSRSHPCADAHVLHEVLRYGSHYWKAIALSNILREVAATYNFEYLDIMQHSINRCDAMVASSPVGMKASNVSDCTHYCVPGVPDAWNVELMKFLLTEKI